MNKLDELFLDFIGENAMAGDFKLMKLNGRYHVQCGAPAYFIPLVSVDNEDCTNIRQVKELLQHWTNEAKETAVNVYNDIDHDNWEVMESWDDDSNYLGQYVGTVMQLTPTGCYYTPFSNSNVDIIGASKDSIFYTELESLLDKHNYWLESGEGSATDLFVCKHGDNEAI